MKTILIYTSPARGHLYPMMDIAIALRAKGHRVVVQTLSSERKWIVGEGLEFRPISADIESLALEDYKAGNPLSQIKSAFARWLERAPHEVDDLRDNCAEIAPDLLVVDVNSWGASAFAEAERRAWAMFMPYCMPMPSPDAPAFGPGFPPPRGWMGRLRDRMFWGVLNVALSGIVKQCDTLRAGLGVPPLRAIENLYHRPDLLLYRTAEPFEYPRSTWPSNIQAIGPGLWAPPSEPPTWLDDLPHPRVLVSVSTEFQEDGAIIETALSALRDEPGSMIVTTAALDPERFSMPHYRVRITRFLPHTHVITKVDLVITHGGMGTTQRALAAGVPVCVIPWGRDQNETARRAEICGAGIMIPRSKLSVEGLRSAARDALTRKAAAAKIAAAFIKAGGAARAVDHIEALLEKTERPRLARYATIPN